MVSQSVAGLPRSIELMPIPMILTDPHQPDNPIIAANAAFGILTGFSQADIIGRNCRFLAGPGTEPEARLAIRDALQKQQPAFIEITNYRADGNAFRNGLTITPLIDRNGQLLLFMGCQIELGRIAQRQGPRLARATKLVDQLSPRLAQILTLVAAGLRNQQIADELSISIKTVKMHRERLLTTLGVRTSAQAIRIAIEADLALSADARLQSRR